MLQMLYKIINIANNSLKIIFFLISINYIKFILKILFFLITKSFSLKYLFLAKSSIFLNIGTRMA
ncbi:MAG: hypothetical protein EAZ97_15005 [Bacteroidetes bacterium]|nr:MAG: hypothetical protein EAZ97_15005 [Bacteroidota bacterium]